MINCELPKKIEDLSKLAHQFAADGLRPISRKYDELEQKEMPEELYELSGLLNVGGVQSEGTAKKDRSEEPKNRNGSNMTMAIASAEICWGDTGLFLAMPTIGLGNAAVAAVATDEQKAD